MNRCVSITKNNTQCRAKLNGNYLFCCTDHEPINKDFVDKGCFMCMEKVTKTNEVLFFKCKHAFHKECYFEWLKYSTYDEPICLICRNISLKKKEVQYKKPLKKVIDTSKLDDIFISLGYKYYNKNNCICEYCADTSSYMFDYKNGCHTYHKFSPDPIEK